MRGVESLLRPADRARAALMRALGPRFVSAVVLPRERRVAATGVALVSSAAVASLLAPLWVLMLGPLLWGIPHLLADVRYLFARAPRRERVWLAVLVGACCVGVAVGVGGPTAAGCCVAAAALARPDGAGRRYAVMAGAGALGLLALEVGRWADVFYAHAHNYVAVLLWLGWRARRGRAHWLVVGAVALGSALVFLVGADAMVVGELGGLGFHEVSAVLSGGQTTPLALRFIVLFAFMQSVHYVAWLRLIPDEDRRRDPPPTFRDSYRRLRADVGRAPLLLLAVGCVALIGWACLEPAEARRGYFDLAVFHGYLELVVIAFLLVQGRRPGAHGSR